MKLKKFFLAVLAVVLICAISVTGTLAYMTAQTEAVTNTFLAASGLVTSLTLDESEAKYVAATGLYELDKESRKQANSYTVLPGTTLPKDPTVHLNDKTDTPAFLYIEVVDNTGGAISCTIDNTKWTGLSAATGPHGGVVYQYTGTALPAGDSDVTIIQNNTITVNDNEAVKALGANGKNIVFYAYMAQASIDGATDAAAIFNACFKSN